MPPTTSRRQAKDALFDALARVAKALASGRRAEIVEVLAQGERTVDQVAAEIGQSLANTSHHLRALARAGLLTSRREGTHIHYALADDDVLRAWWALRRVAAQRQDDVDALARDYLGDRTGLHTISRDELQALLDRGDVLLLDVRPEAEYAAGHIPGAINIPPDRLDAALDDLPSAREVVAYCRGPYCVYADDAVRHLLDRGHRARRLEDGYPEWRIAFEASRPLRRSEA
jgi:rhodanese-related sulfurtransferase/DNA-binding transcriptional ArsR family regulator